MAKRKRRVRAVKDELVHKSREAALAAVQVFNNPQITFKSEMFIVLMVIAWTYLLHAHYRDKKVEYRHFKQTGRRRRFVTTKHGAQKYWGLEDCLDAPECPLDDGCKTNLKFLVGLRHEIEHRMTSKIDDLLSAKFQACCLNYNDAIKGFFGDRYAIERHLAFSLQFSSLSEEQIAMLGDREDLPGNIKKFVEGFDGELSIDEYNSPKYAYRVIFVPKLVSKREHADKAIEFVRADSEEAKGMNKAYTVIRETEREKFRPGSVVEAMHQKGFPKFNMHHHTELWKAEDARREGKGFGTEVEGQWFWYQRWIDHVGAHCEQNRGRYS